MLMAQAKPNRLGSLIRERRDRAGLTQEALAEAIGTERTTITSIERGQTRRPGPEVLNALARVLPVTVSELVKAMGYALEEDKERVERVIQEQTAIVAKVDLSTPAAILALVDGAFIVAAARHLVQALSWRTARIRSSR